MEETGLALRWFNKKEDLYDLDKEQLIEVLWNHMENSKKTVDTIVHASKEELLELQSDWKFWYFFGKVFRGEKVE